MLTFPNVKDSLLSLLLSGHWQAARRRTTVTSQTSSALTKSGNFTSTLWLVSDGLWVFFFFFLWNPIWSFHHYFGQCPTFITHNPWGVTADRNINKRHQSCCHKVSGLLWPSCKKNRTDFCCKCKWKNMHKKEIQQNQDWYTYIYIYIFFSIFFIWWPHTWSRSYCWKQQCSAIVSGCAASSFPLTQSLWPVLSSHFQACRYPKNVMVWELVW